MFSGAEESTVRRAPSSPVPQTVLRNGGGLLSMFHMNACDRLFGPIKVMNRLTIIVIRFIFAGRSANVWTPLWSFHRLCLRHVKLHKVKGARTSGLFETHTYPDVLFVCVSLFFCQTKPSPAGLKMCAVNCFVLAVVFCIACIVLYCIGFKVFVSVLVFCIGFSVLNCLQCFVLVVGFAAKAHGLS